MSSKKAKYLQHPRTTRRLKENIKRELTIPWAPGFKPPGERDRLRAVGFEERGFHCKEFQPGIHFDPIPEPVSDKDWLANQKEDGQSYLQFTGTCPWSQKKKFKGYKEIHNCKETVMDKKYPNGKIYLLQLLSECDSQIKHLGIDAECLKEYTEMYYGIATAILPSVYLRKQEDGDLIISGSVATKEENGGHTLSDGIVGIQNDTEFSIYPTYRQNDEGSRFQLRIDTGLSDLETLMPPDGLFLVCVTMVDLYCDKTDLFTVGIGSCKNRLGIFSFLRYDPFFKQLSDQFWYEYEIADAARNNEERCKLVLQRSIKTVVHEVGHLLGFNHCIFYQCLMNGSGHLEEDFKQPIHLCPVDLHKICFLTGMDIIGRYQKLLNFYKLRSMKVEASWIASRLSWLNE